jgi:protein gp37
MGKTTEIQWCDSTVNPVMGCAGCELWDGKLKICYAGVLHARHHERHDQRQLPQGRPRW